jgi:predicted ATPase
VSSTLRELEPERAAVRRTIEGLRFTPVMFELGARPHPPQALYRAYLEQSDVFVGIYGQSYGWVAPGMEVSGLEDEYELSRSLPRLVYVKAAGEREPGLRRLLERIAADDVSYRRFETAGEIAELVADDLALLVSESFTHRRGAEPGRIVAIPAPASSFVGREHEVEELVGLLSRSDVRLVTLTGPGGIGKTRLALESAQRVSGELSDDIVFVPLAAVKEPTEVPPTILRALGASVDGETPAADQLGAHLARRDLLLVLDNMEHLLDAGRLVVELLAVAPGLRVLATSRMRLDVSGEHLFHVPPMIIPEPGEREVGAIERSDAVRLFEARAQAAGWTTTEADAPIVADIVRRLDGLPLAIELAAAQARLVPAELVHTRLRRRLDLGGGPRDAEERHRTLRSTIAWSYDLLDEPARRFFEELSVFVGGFSLDAAEALVEGRTDVEELLASLVDASMVTTGPSPVTGVRFDMLDTIREYAAERLEDRGGRAEAVRRHIAYFANLADEADAAPVESMPLAHLRQDEERDNLRAALEEATRMSPDAAVRLAGALEHLWSSRGLTREGREALARALAAAPDAPAGLRARALLAAAWLAAEQSDYAEADRLALDALELFREVGDSRNVGESLNALGWSAERQGDSEAALRYFEECYRVLAPVSGEPMGVMTTIHMARWLVSSGDLDEARRLYAEALRSFELLGLDDGRVSVLLHLGEIDEESGDLGSARRYYDECRSISRRIENSRVLASALVALAHLDAGAGQGANAARGYAEALDIQLQLGDRTGAAHSLEGLAAVAMSCDEAKTAARLIGAARAKRAATGEKRSAPTWEAEAAEAQRAALAALGEELFERETAAGAALDAAGLLALVEETASVASGAS